jgi:hypothetical protein
VKDAGRSAIVLLGWLVAGCDGDHLLGTIPGPETTDADDGEVTVSDVPDEGDGPDDDASVETGDDGGAEADAGGALSVFVGRNRWSWGVVTTDPVPLADVWVALDSPGGERVELQTGADGKAKFNGIDWSMGTASVIAAKEGHSAAGRVGLTSADSEVTLLLDELGPPTGMVEITGTALHLAPGGCLFVTATVTGKGNYSCDGTLDYTLYVVPGVPFQLVGWSQASTYPVPSRGADWPVLGTARLDHPPITGPTTIDLDFAAGPTPTRVRTSFALPSSPDSLLAAFASGSVLVRTRETGMLLGRTVLAELNAEGTGFDTYVDFVVVPEVEDVVTEYDLVLPSAGRWNSSWTVEEGYPTEGAHDPGFLEVPGFLTARAALHGTWRWELYDAGVRVTVGVLREPDLLGLVSVDAPDDTTTATIPALPSAIVEDAFFGAGTILGFVAAFRLDPSGRYIQRLAQTDPFSLER